MDASDLEQELRRLLLIMQSAREPARTRAFESLVRKMDLKVLAFLRKHGAVHEQAKELTQSVFLKVWTKVRQWRGEGATGWILQIALRLWQDVQRSLPGRMAASTQRLDDDGVQSQVEQGDNSDIDRETVECVRSALQAFRRDHPQYAEVFALFELGGSTIRELAALRGSTEAATKDFLYQCRKRLRPYLRDCL